jgi:hypothetical protein
MRPPASRQPRPSLTHQLERLVPEFDALIQRAGLVPHSVADIDDMETMAQALAAKLIEPFRGTGARPAHAPLYLSPDRRKAMW